mmetsp:Transcript_6480/g.7429  ORF Transcript_6480/g.7429 Transcript_6480/m.7429 type:complete len:141 (-) Transcript_6480:155-577(-)
MIRRYIVFLLKDRRGRIEERPVLISADGYYSLWSFVDFNKELEGRTRKSQLVLGLTSPLSQYKNDHSHAFSEQKNLLYVFEETYTLCGRENLSVGGVLHGGISCLQCDIRGRSGIVSNVEGYAESHRLAVRCMEFVRSTW